MRIGYGLFKAALIHLHEIAPILLMSRTNPELGDLKVPHVRNIDGRAKAHFVAVGVDARTKFGQLLAIHQSRVIERCGQRCVLRHVRIVLLPCCERRIANKEQRTRKARLRLHREVVRWPLRRRHCLNESTLRLEVRVAGSSRLQHLTLDNQHLRRPWWHLMCRRNAQASNQTRKNKTPC